MPTVTNVSVFNNTADAYSVQNVNGILDDGTGVIEVAMSKDQAEGLDANAKYNVSYTDGGHALTMNDATIKGVRGDDTSGATGVSFKN